MPTSRTAADSQTARRTGIRRAMIGGAVLTGYFVALTVLELRRPVRGTREPKLRRLARKLAMATISAATVSLAHLIDCLSGRSRFGTVCPAAQLNLGRTRRASGRTTLLP